MKIILISGIARSGKDTTAELLSNKLIDSGKTVLITHFADLLKYTMIKFFNWNGVKDDTSRSLMQKIGTDIVRKENPNYWVAFLESFLSMFKNEWEYVLVSDFRFKNEHEYFLSKGWDCKAIRVERLEFESELTKEQKQHESETALDSYNFDYYLRSKSGIDNLTLEVDKLYEFIIK